MCAEDRTSRTAFTAGGHPPSNSSRPPTAGGYWPSSCSSSTDRVWGCGCLRFTNDQLQAGVSLDDVSTLLRVAVPGCRLYGGVRAVGG